MKIRPIFKTYELGNYFWGGSANAICELYARKKVEMLFAWAEHLLLMTIALPSSLQTLGSSAVQHYILILGAAVVHVDFFFQLHGPDVNGSQ